MFIPLLAVSIVDLAMQAMVTVVVVVIYHLWTLNRKANSRPIETPAPSQVIKVPEPVVVPKAQVPAIAPPMVSQSVDTVEGEILAVIAAAIAIVLDGPARILSVQQVAAPVPHLNVWAMEGRLEIFTSHKVR